MIAKLRMRLLYVVWCVLGALGSIGAAEAAFRALDVPSGSATAASAPAWMDAATLARWERFARHHGIEVADIEDLKGWRWDGTLRWALRPGLGIEATNLFAGPADGDPERWTLETNSRGYRTPEFRDAPTPGRLRVVTVGDSNTMGWLLDGGEAYPRRLEVYLADALDSPVDVINLGVGGYTSFSCRRTLLDVALPLQPDAIVLSCGANDPQRFGMSDADYANRFGGPLGVWRFRLGQLHLVAALRGLGSTGEGERARRVTPSNFARNVADVFAAVAERDIPLAFLQVCLDPMYATPLAKAAERSGVPVVDAIEEAERTLLHGSVPARYRGALAEVRERFPADLLEQQPELHFLLTDRCHLNAVGADVAAAALARELARELSASAS